MDFAHWSTFAGLLLIGMALSATLLERLPLSSSMLYLGIGAAASPLWLSWSTVSLAEHHHVIERLTEIVVLLSLFSSGLKMSAGLGDRRWLPPLRLATLSMVVTVALIAVAGVQWLGLSLGAAILLGGILAPTDPVLAADVQLSDPDDRDRLRYSLTGEAGLNDGTAFPVVMLGLGLLGVHEIGELGWRWLAIDLLWAVAAGLAVGAAMGTAVGQLVLHLRRRHREALGLDNFLALGLIALAYGVALLLHASGFLAVFAAGVALRRLETRATASETAMDSKRGESSAGAGAATGSSHEEMAAAQSDPTVDREELAADPSRAPSYMAHAVMNFNEQLERMGEVAAVVCVGMLLWSVQWPLVNWGFVAACLLIARPISVWIGLWGSRVARAQRGLIGWFGIRGIGSLYYVAFALSHGLSARESEAIVATTLAIIATSVVVHGISVTPLMARYERQKKR